MLKLRNLLIVGGAVCTIIVLTLVVGVTLYGSNSSLPLLSHGPVPPPDCDTCTLAHGPVPPPDCDTCTVVAHGPVPPPDCDTCTVLL